MMRRLIQRVVRKRATRFVPSLIRTAFKPLITRARAFDPRLLSLGIDAVRPDDCFLVSYPRSGNTWLRFVIASLLAPNDEITFRNIDKFIPDPERTTLDIEKMASPRIMKTHWPYFDVFPRFAYVVRDPRDVFISYYHYASNNGWFDGDLESFSSFPVIYGTWADHVDSAFRCIASRPDRALLLKYEQLLSDALAEVRRLARFFGLNNSDDEIEAALAKNSFTSLKSKEQTYGPERDTASGFFRAGTSGQWRSRLSPGQLCRMTEEYRPFLERLGYDIA
jgi:estrone sulfotransferase